MPELLSIGISHKTAPVALRERLSLASGQAKQLMHDLVSDDEIHEAVAISTCNRTELYLVTSDSVSAESAALGRLASLAHIPPTELVAQLYTSRGSDVAAHLMRVASGLDSMVVGESEILGQVKRAYEAALESQVTGPITNRLFSGAIAAGKRVQSETRLGEGKLSVSSTAVELARQTAGDLTGKQALVIGAGRNGELTARTLASAGVATVFVANRRHSRAIGVAETIGGRAVRLEHLPEELAKADIVLGSTSSPHTLLHAEEMREVMEARGGRPLVIIDIAVPRDVEPAVGGVPGITLYDIDDLQESVARTVKTRRSEEARAEGVVAQEVEKFERWTATLDVIPTISQLREYGAAIASQAVAENAAKFEGLTPADRKRLDAMAASIVTRMLHEPTLRLKQTTAEDGAYFYLQALREMFGLDSAPASNVEDDDDHGKVAKVHSLDEQRSRGHAQS